MTLKGDFCFVVFLPDEITLKNAVGDFVGANLFARASRYVRMNSHLHQQRIAENWQSIQIQLRSLGSPGTSGSYRSYVLLRTETLSVIAHASG